MGTMADPAIVAVLTTVVDQASRMQQAQNNQAYQQAQVERQNQMIRDQQAVQTRQQEDLLNRQLASARASFGASGAGTDGSSSAVLAGMTQRADQNIADIGTLANDQIHPQAPINDFTGIDNGLQLAQTAGKVVGALNAL